MSIVSITAVFRCDDCNVRFEVYMDPAEKVTEGWCLMEEAEEQYRNWGDGSVVDDKHLCADCYLKEPDTDDDFDIDQTPQGNTEHNL